MFSRLIVRTLKNSVNLLKFGFDNAFSAPFKFSTLDPKFSVPFAKAIKIGGILLKTINWPETSGFEKNTK